VTARHLLVLLAGVVAVSWSAPLIRLADDAPSLTIAALRLSIAAPVMGAIAVGTRPDELRRVTRRDLLLLVLSGLALAGHFAFWIASIQRTSVVASVVLVTMNPIFVGLGAWAWLRERPSADVLTGTAIALSGALLLAVDDLGDRGSLIGDLMALIGSVLASVYLVIGRGVRARMSTVGYTAVVNGVAAIALLIVMFSAGAHVRGLEGETYLFIALIAVGPQLIGHNSFNWALGSLPAAVVAIAILGEPVGATLIATVLLDEVPTLLEWLGAAVLLAGVYVALRRSRMQDLAATEEATL
jgi:drug/metabolite transporter (DMT)-like permease